jgi:hypothetical protein
MILVMEADMTETKERVEAVRRALTIGTLLVARLLFQEIVE